MWVIQVDMRLSSLYRTTLWDDGGDVSTLGIRIRELQLQDDMQPDDVEHMFAEFVNIACAELYNGESPDARREALELLTRLYEGHGRPELDRLGEPGRFLEFMADRCFNKYGFQQIHSYVLQNRISFICYCSVIEDFHEHGAAFLFYVNYAKDHPAFRKFVLLPNGLLLLVSRLKDALSWQTSNPALCPKIPRTCTWAVADLSECHWATPILQKLDLCPFLVQLLTCVLFSSTSIIIEITF
jgi:hypothetical protein